MSEVLRFPESLPRGAHPPKAMPSDTVRPTRAEIDLSCIRFNLRSLRQRTSAQIWAVLKADGYGHGAKTIGRTLERAGVDGLCVALVEEGIELRTAGIDVPILVMSNWYGGAYSELLEHQLTPVIYEPKQLKAFAREAERHNRTAVPIHIKVDTGMSRLGTMPSELGELLGHLKAAPQLQLEGVMTHFASADSDREKTLEQLARFEESCRFIAEAGFSPRLRHACNSAGLLAFPEAHLDMVRPGLCIFGVSPLPEQSKLRQAIQLHSKIISLRSIESGETVGYNGQWQAQRRSIIATIPIGYADGFPRSCSNHAEVLVHGRRVPVVGRVSMDLTTLDVTDVPEARIGDDVTLLGSQRGSHGEDHISVEELAKSEETIPWEVLTTISKRVPRYYRGA